MIVTWAGRAVRPYEKVTKTGTEVISVDYKVVTNVTFKSRLIEKYTYDNLFRIHSHLELEPEESYMFCVSVHITGDEYEKNKYNKEKYVCDLAAESFEYKKLLKECLEKVTSDREYEIYSYIAMDEDGEKLNTEKYTYEEYVPIHNL